MPVIFLLLMLLKISFTYILIMVVHFFHPCNSAKLHRAPAPRFAPYTVARRYFCAISSHMSREFSHEAKISSRNNHFC